MAVGDVEGEDAAGGEVAAVEVEGLAGEQVDGDGVAGEGVDDKDVEVLGFFAGQGRAGVALDDADLGGRIAYVAEDIAGDGDDGGVDVVEGDVVGRACRRRRWRWRRGR